jgi:hypothetical protein
VWFTLTVGGTLHITGDTYPQLVDGHGAVGRMSADGQVNEFYLPDRTQQPDQITAFDGQLWLSAYVAEQQSANPELIWRMSTSGVFTPATPPGQYTTQFLDDTSASGGRLWYAMYNVDARYTVENAIGYLDATGQPHPVTLPDTLRGEILGIVIGPDRNPWYLISRPGGFTSPDVRRIVRVDPDGMVSVVASVPCGGVGAGTGVLVRTAHGDVWCGSAGAIYEVNPTGIVTTYDTRLHHRDLDLNNPFTGFMPHGAAVAPNGSVRFTDPDNDRILRY